MSDYLDSDISPRSPHLIIDELKRGFERFKSCRTDHPHATAARVHQLIGGQHPQVALLACSDSRVPIEVIFDAGFGDLFVIRNAGNTNTFGSAGSIEYAVLDLKVPVLVVMSHQGCGAVKAAFSKNSIFSKSLTELVEDIKQGLIRYNIDVNDSTTYQEACVRHAAITAESLMKISKDIHDAVRQKRLFIQPAYLHIDPIQIDWLTPYYGDNF
ncbi:hypothetical protein N8506_02685 [Synechococcus sp. AH-601-N23]|nr:hypothetical protein [Synechococcus sp. AH-601-N23]